MTNHARNGAARERKVRDHMLAAGWELIARSAGSKGPADLVMASATHGLGLVQVGTAASKQLGPAARDRLLHAANLSGCPRCGHSALPLAALTSRAGIAYWLVGRGAMSTWDKWEVGL